MTHAVRFTSLKGKTAGTTVFERYDSAKEAEFVASVMRAGGHRDAVAVLIEA